MNNPSSFPPSPSKHRALARRLGVSPLLFATLTFGCASAGTDGDNPASATDDVVTDSGAPVDTDTTTASDGTSVAPGETATSSETSAQDNTNDTSADGSGDTEEQQPDPPIDPAVTTAVNAAWIQENTVSLRVDLPLAYRGQALSAQLLADQLAGYDPGSLLRCAVADDTNYRAAIDALGGVSWGYAVSLLEDQSKPRIYAGYQRTNLEVPQAASDGAGAAAVEIVKPDIVAVTDSAALFYSSVHGLLLVSLEGDTPQFKCAAQVPGKVNQFFFHQGHLVAMTKSQSGQESALLHFEVTGSEVQFVESVSLGNVNILDSRRFNDKLVFYTDLHPESTPAPVTQPNNPNGGADIGIGPISAPETKNRALHVYRLGDTLGREMYDTLIDTSVSQEQLFDTVTADTPPDTLVNEAHWYGHNMWASDHYFVVTEQVTKTLVDYWRTDVYSVCTQSHTTEQPYNYCWTEYETRPNPDYVEPDNSGGDRSCNGVTLSDCLVQVARVANKTINVPVGQKCEQRIRYNWVCEAYEQRTAEYPVYKYEDSTRLYIYEYTAEGFVQVDTQVHEVANTGLEDANPEDTIEAVTTSTETFDLAVPGSVQTLYFQNGYLYVISKGVLQAYAMGGSSIVRTATLSVVNDSLQSSLFTSEQLFLSDFGYSGGADHSTLRVVDLSNPAFPKVQGSTHDLPGGHRSILATNEGIFTIGTVQEFMGQTVNALKLGLFGNPYAEETAYLILGTDLSNSGLGLEEAQYFDSSTERLLLPYWGQNEGKNTEYRIGVSRLEPGTIKSEGAVVVPEPVERVRRLPVEAPSYLSFAPNSIEWLTPLDAEWQTQPILEYLLPNNVYRLNDDNDYVEFQRLGARCRLYFANANDINQRQDGAYSDEFTCSGWPVAYANNLIFPKGSVEFNTEHSIRALSDDEVAAIQVLINERPICVLSDEFFDNPYVAPKDIPENAEVTCMSPEEYYQHSNQTPTP